MAIFRAKRRAPTGAELDGVLAIGNGSAAFAADGWMATGVGSICLRPSDGTPMVSAEMSTDAFGHTWLTRRAARSDLAMMASQLRELSGSVMDAEYGPSLLCALVAFRDGADEPMAMAMIYRFRRGAWYPFVPIAEHKRDNARELGLQAALVGDMPIERDLSKWSPLWDAPGMPVAAAKP